MKQARDHLMALTTAAAKMLADGRLGLPRKEKKTIYVFAGSFKHCKQAIDDLDIKTLGDILTSRRLMGHGSFEYALEMISPGDIHKLRARRPQEGDLVIWGHFDREPSDDFYEELHSRGFL